MTDAEILRAASEVIRRRSRAKRSFAVDVQCAALELAADGIDDEDRQVAIERIHQATEPAPLRPHPRNWG